MNQIWEIIDGAGATSGTFTPLNVTLSLLLAFVLGQALTWVYYFTHSGLSYSKTFVQSLVLITVVMAVIMAVIGNNVITAFGLMGALAIIRFRNVVKDTRDIVYIFCSLAVGMAAGSQRYTIAIIGTVILILISIYLHLTNFGSHRPHNGFLRFVSDGYVGPSHPVLAILKRFCGNFTLISAQNGGVGDAGVEYAYQLIIRNARKNEQLLTELDEVDGIGNINLVMQEQLLEV